MIFDDQPLFLLALALVPPIALMIFILLKDKHKDSFGYLFKFFLVGVVSTIPAAIIEVISQKFLLDMYMTYSITFVIIALSVGVIEEFAKYIFLKSNSWRNPRFDYSYNGIVFSVFVSLGFAAFENIGYVFQYGYINGIMRAVTSIPGHASFAVFMGYFYIRAKKAYVEGDKGKSFGYRVLALVVPAVIHGVYDMILMLTAGGISVGPFFTITLFDEPISYPIVWVIFVIIFFIMAFIIVNNEAKDEYCFVGNGAATNGYPGFQSGIPTVNQPMFGANGAYVQVPVNYQAQPAGGVMTPPPMNRTPVINVAASAVPVPAQATTTASSKKTVAPSVPVAASVPTAASVPSAASAPVAASTPSAASAPVAASVAAAPSVASAPKAQELPWKCNACGGQNYIVGKFCTNCGAPRK